MGRNAEGGTNGGGMSSPAPGPKPDGHIVFGTALARTLLSAAGGVAGYLIGMLLVSRGVLSGPNNLLFISIVGLLGSYLLSAPLAARAGRLWRRFMRRANRVQPDVVVAAGAGATVGLLITILINNVMASMPGFTWYWSQLIALVLVVGIAGFAVANRRQLRIPGHPPTLAPPINAVSDKVVDTSAIIDGRIVDVIDSNFMEGKLLLPQFVLAELQRIADSDDPLRRQRGRRGLEVLDRIAEHPRARTQVIHDDTSGPMPVDDKLIDICRRRGHDLITTDYNLSRVAALQGVRVLNLHQLASALKATYMPGERLALNIVRMGREPGQGLAYLEDGTMVVVEDAADKVGTTLDTVVTSSLQTNMGRMIFARPTGSEHG